MRKGIPARRSSDPWSGPDAKVLLPTLVKLLEKTLDARGYNLVLAEALGQIVRRPTRRPGCLSNCFARRIRRSTTVCWWWRCRSSAIAASPFFAGLELKPRSPGKVLEPDAALTPATRSGLDAGLPNLVEAVDQYATP